MADFVFERNMADTFLISSLVRDVITKIASGHNYDVVMKDITNDYALSSSEQLSIKKKIKELCKSRTKKTNS